MRSQNTFRIAFCGIIAALGVILMFLTGLITVMTFALPALAGALLIPVVNEAGIKWGLSVYALTAILSIFFAGDKQAALLYLLFFGYYPILLAWLQKLQNRIVVYVIKFAVFNLAFFAALALTTFVLSLPVERIPFLGDFTIPILCIAGNLIFLLYDQAINRLISMYIYRLRDSVKHLFRF